MVSRTFSRPHEYRSLDGYKEDNPVSADNYFGVVGDYCSPDYEEQCCYLKDNGKLCRRDHKFGYVVQLKDQSFSIIGNRCAESKFDADSALRLDISRFREQREIRETLGAIADLLASETKVTAVARQALDSVGDARRRITEFERRVGCELANMLHGMGRSHSTAVNVTGVRVRAYKDEEGNKKEEKTYVTLTAGRLQGVTVFPRFRGYSEHREKQGMEHAFSRARQLDDQIALTELQHALVDLRRHEEIVREAKELRELADTFFASDIPTIAFLTSDSSYRYEPVRVYLKNAGEAHSKEKAKQWVYEAAEALKYANNVQRLQI